MRVAPLSAIVAAVAVMAGSPGQSALEDFKISARLGKDQESCPEFNLEIEAKGGMVTGRMKGGEDPAVRAAQFDETTGKGSSSTGIVMNFRRGSCAFTITVKRD